MTLSPLAKLAAAATSLFVAALVGVMIWVAADDVRPGRFQARFNLVDDRGAKVDETIFHHAPSLVYFGYTHCPEVCPTTLFEMAGWLRDLGPEAKDLQALFFTVDPERDTPDIMHGYVTAFTDRITGVTGDAGEMRKVVEGWMAHAAKLPGDVDDYHMSHTTSLLLIGADGRLKDMIAYGTEKEDALSRIRSLLRQSGMARVEAKTGNAG
ncbi:electron transporter [Xaviernesmea oryzae]|uniref:Electron transporter n=1 Tax=Xaviernesmea oryzae TaxID=464029 RepID=A0A1Q9B123_9HYPH|nr:SCO family protein [Xaviernesmea oryzae]OLP61689.1 electron transporter [Xaviernesmea oryzae]SEL02424.1 protein SCO1/2 [Xaviernesmea oryzae]